MSAFDRFRQLAIVRLILARRWTVLGVLVLGLLAIPFVLHKLPVTYIGEAQVLLVNENSSSRDPLVETADLPELATSSVVIERALARIHNNATVEEIRKNLTARVGLRSNLLPLSYKSPSATLAMSIPNAIGAEMVSYYHEISTRQYDNLIAQLKARNAAQAAVINRINAKIQQDSANNVTAAADGSVDIDATGYSTLERDRTVAYSELVEDQALARSAASAPRQLSGVVRQEVVASNPLYAKVRDQTAKDEASLVAIRSSYTDSYPGLADLNDRVKRENKELGTVEHRALASGAAQSPTYDRAVIDAQKAAGMVDGDRAKVAAIDAALGQLRQRAQSPDSVQIATLKAERAGAAQAYAATSVALTDAEANKVETSSLGSLIVIDRATEALPRVIHVAAVLPILILLAFGLALGTAYLAEQLDPRFRSASDIESVFGRPVIGSVGKFSPV